MSRILRMIFLFCRVCGILELRHTFYIVPILDNLVKNTSSVMENGISFTHTSNLGESCVAAMRKYSFSLFLEVARWTIMLP